MKKILLHGHIFKNAGSTLDWSLQRSFGDAFYEHRNDRDMRRDAAQELQQAFSQRTVRALSSHSLPCPVPPIDGCEAFPVFMLRHPLQRIQSVYKFERKQKADTPGAKAAKVMNLEEYLRWRMRGDVGPTIRNFQVRYLAGRMGRRPGVDVGVEDFRNALAALEQIENIGVVEHYDESMVLFEASLGEHFPELDLAYVAQNVSTGSKRDSGDDPLDAFGAMRDEVLERNSLDLALYSLALQRFRSRCDALPNFARRVDKLRQRSEALRSRRRLKLRMPGF